ELDSCRQFSARNPAGTVTKEAWSAVRKSIAVDCTSVLDIDGEEDLLALPAVTMLPDDALIVYGLREKGAVVMEVGEVRDFVQEILDLGRKGRVIVGGSWRFLHAGHRYLLLRALELGEKADIGVTSDRMLEEKLGREPGEKFERRKERVENFVYGHPQATRVIEIDDVYGNAVEEGDCLLVTPETQPNADRINRKREEMGKETLDIEVMEKLEAADGDPVSSTRVDRGDIDRDGRKKSLL
ncbi:MAG: pantetheine-phosphate adenylyltransferase, partial [Candidatus Nanohaloarchaea archaeon]